MRYSILLILGLWACSSSKPQTKAAPNKSPRPELSDDQLFLAARGYLDRNEAQKALAVIEDLIKKPGLNAEQLDLAAKALAGSGRLEESLPYYQKLLAQNSEKKGLMMELASVYDVLKRYTEANVVYQNILKQFPDDVDARQQLGLNALAQGETQSGIEFLKEALNRTPNSSSLKGDLAYAYHQNGQSQEALTLLEGLAKGDAPSPDTLKLYAQILSAQKRWEDANRALDKMSNDAAPELIAFRARFRIATMRPDAALSDLATLEKSVQGDVGLQLLKSGALILKGETQMAKSILLALPQAFQNHPLTIFRKLHLSAVEGDPKAFDELWSYALEKQSSPSVWWAVHQAAQKQNNPKRLEKAQNKLRELGIENPPA